MLGASAVVLDQKRHWQRAGKWFLVTLPFWVAGLLTAGVATLYARAFQYIEQRSGGTFEAMGYWALLVVPGLFVMSWFLVDVLAPMAGGSGIPQLMAAAELSQRDATNGLIRKLLSLRVAAVKIVSSLLGVLGGGAIGREGPTLQIAGSIFYFTGRVLGQKIDAKDQHVLLLAGGAAGLASAFNTPLGGIVYVMEELSRSHLAKFRTGVLHAVIVAGLASQLIMGPYLYLGYPKIVPFELNQIGLMAGAAIAGGLVVSIFGQTLKFIVVYRAGLAKLRSRALVAAGCGLALALMAVFITHTALGSGKDLLNELLFTAREASGFDVLSRFFGTVVTYLAGGAGGIFAPVLSLGGVSASYFSQLVDSGMGSLAVLIGMTAGLAALTQSPFTSFVLVLEMTDRHSAIFPLMMAALVGQGISKMVSRISFYEFSCHRILGLPEAAPQPLKA